MEKDKFLVKPPLISPFFIVFEYDQSFPEKYTKLYVPTGISVNVKDVFFLINSFLMVLPFLTFFNKKRYPYCMVHSL